MQIKWNNPLARLVQVWGIKVIREGQERRRPIYSESNAISLYLDKGLLEHYAGNYRKSAQDLWAWAP
jgi:hypothetical protein